MLAIGAVRPCALLFACSTSRTNNRTQIIHWYLDGLCTCSLSFFFLCVSVVIRVCVFLGAEVCALILSWLRIGVVVVLILLAPERGAREMFVGRLVRLGAGMREEYGSTEQWKRLFRANYIKHKLTFHIMEQRYIQCTRGHRWQL